MSKRVPRTYVETRVSDADDEPTQVGAERRRADGSAVDRARARRARRHAEPRRQVGVGQARAGPASRTPARRSCASSTSIGGHLIMVGRALAWLPRRPFRGKNYLEAMEYIGFGSLPIVLLVGVFTGMVMSLQSVNAFRQFGFESFSGGATGKALALELGPVLTSLMLAGRAGAGIATELGTMRITEQIDALESMAVNPHPVPRPAAHRSPR